MELTTAIALLSVIIGLIYFWILRSLWIFEVDGFLHEKPVFPSGNTKGVGKDYHLVHKELELYKKFKGKALAFGMYFFTTPHVVVTDLEIVKNVLVRDFDSFHNRGVYFNSRDEPLSGHLFAIEGAEWRKLRTKLTPTFTSGKMKMMFDTVLNISEVMKQQLDKDSVADVVELKETLSKFTTDVIGNIAFGLEMNSIQDPDSMFRKMGKKIFKPDFNMQFKAFIMAGFRSLANALHMKLFSQDASEFFMSSIKDTFKYRQEQNVQRNDVLDLLMKLHEKGEITFNELAAQCFVYFFAGKYQNMQVIDTPILSAFFKIAVHCCDFQALKQAAQHRHSFCTYWPPIFRFRRNYELKS